MTDFLRPATVDMTGVEKGCNRQAESVEDGEQGGKGLLLDCVDNGQCGGESTTGCHSQIEPNITGIDDPIRMFVPSSISTHARLISLHVCNFRRTAKSPSHMF